MICFQTTGLPPWKNCKFWMTVTSGSALSSQQPAQSTNLAKKRKTCLAATSALFFLLPHFFLHIFQKPSSHCWLIWTLIFSAMLFFTHFFLSSKLLIRNIVVCVVTALILCHPCKVFGRRVQKGCNPLLLLCILCLIIVTLFQLLNRQLGRRGRAEGI